MKDPSLLLLLIITLSSFQASADTFNADLAWQEFSQAFNENYAYRDTSGVAVAPLLAEYKKRALKASSESEFIHLVQIFLRYFRDPHLNIYPGNQKDYSVTPTGADIWATELQGKYYIIDIKAGSAAASAGMQVNSEIIFIDGLATSEAIAKVYGNFNTNLTTKQKVWGLNIALGGIKNQAREVITRYNGKEHTYHLAATYDAIKREYKGPRLSFKTIDNLGYIRFNNSLGSQDTVADFKHAIEELITTDGLILDLRNIPSGGNTGVAEPILGHFVDNKTVYQLYQQQQPSSSFSKVIPFHQAKMEKAITKPSLPFYNKPLVVLVGRWTGSIAEGMMIGLDALGADAIIGAPTADLLGGIKNIKLSHSNAVVDIAFERLFHVNGTFREDFEADITLDTADWGKNGSDPALNIAIKRLKSKIQ